ncbi:MAG: insulinase family protein, partial [bacterium]
MLIIFLLAAVLTPAAAQDVDLNEELPWNPALTRGVLENGFAYFIRENKKPEKRAEVRLYVKAGSILEEDSEQGIAHYLEHMAFNGTANFPPGELDKFLELLGMEIGSDNNAFTSFDRTVYILTVPVEGDNLDTAFTVMADYAGGMLFLPKEVNLERGVILEEERLGRSVERRLFEKGLQIALKGSKYPDRLPIGKVERIEKFSSDDFKRFYRTWYRADRMALAVVGDVDSPEVEAKIRKKFSALPAPPDSEPLPAFPAPRHDETYTGMITDPELPVGGAGLTLTREPSPRRTTGDFYRRTLQNVALAIYNNRLEEIASSAKNPPFKQAGAMRLREIVWFDLSAVYSVANMNRELETLEVILREMERIRRHGVLPEEIAEQIANIEESYRQRVEEKDKTESENLLEDIGKAFYYDFIPTDVEYDQLLFSRLKSLVTLEGVSAAFREMFEPVNMTAILALPRFMKSKYTTEQIEKVIAKITSESIPPYVREEKKKDFDYSKLIPGTIAERETIEGLGITRLVFENGLRVLLKPTDFKEDEIAFNSFAPGGALLENYSTRGLAEVAELAWIWGGTGDFTRTEIERMQSGRTIRLWTDGGYNLSINGETVKKDFEETLQWLYDYITVPGFREEAVERAKKTRIDRIRDLPLNQDEFFRATSEATVCPDSPVTAVPTEQDILRVTPEQVRRLQASSFVPRNVQFSFVGNFDLEEAVRLIARYLGSLPPAEPEPVPENARSCTFPEGITSRTIHRGMEDRTRIMVAFPGPHFLHPDVPALMVLSKIADIRLNDVLREELGGTYYTYFFYHKDYYLKGKDYLQTGFACDPGKVEFMLGKLYEVLENLKKNPPTDEEMTRAREVFKKDFEEDLKKNEFWLKVMRGADAAGRPLDYHHGMYEASLKVTPQQV